MSNHGYAKDFYLLESENILKKIDDLEEANDNITKDMYYNIMNKMIYLTALEFELI